MSPFARASILRGTPVELQEDLAVQQALLVVVRLLEGSGGENGLRAGLAAWRRPPLSEFFFGIGTQCIANV